MRVDFAVLMVEFYCGVCSGYCLDVFTHFSQYYNSSQFTVVQYTLHSSHYHHTIQYYYGVLSSFFFALKKNKIQNLRKAK